MVRHLPGNSRNVRSIEGFLVLFWVITPKDTKHTGTIPYRQGLASCSLQLGGDEKKTCGSNVNDLQHCAHQNGQVLEAKPVGMFWKKNSDGKTWTLVSFFFCANKKGKKGRIRPEFLEMLAKYHPHGPHPTYLKEYILTWEQLLWRKWNQIIFRI